MRQKPRRRPLLRAVLVKTSALLMLGAAIGLPSRTAIAGTQAAGAHKPSLRLAPEQTAAKAVPVARKAKRSSKRKARRSRGNDLELRSGAVLVVDRDSGETLASKNADRVMPIASLTKLMTALVVINSMQPLDEVLEIGREDVDTEKRTHSRLPVGTRLTRSEMLLLALMSSENRAAAALSRHFPGGRAAFVRKMNLEAQSLGLKSTRFVDGTGLSSRNVSTARDLHRLMSAADAQPLIRSYSTQRETTVKVRGSRLKFGNSNRLVRHKGDWDIDLQKTGFTNEAGRCLVMQAQVLQRRLAMIFLDSSGTLTRYADATRVRRKLQQEQKAAIKPAGGNPTAASS